MQIDGKRFLVTGGSGFIGSHVVEGLIESGAREVVVFDTALRPERLADAIARPGVRLVEGDARQVESLHEAMTDLDGVFHLAALPLGPCADDPRRCFEINVLGTFNVIEAAQRAGVGRVVLSSASSVYGDTAEIMDEEHPLNALTMYGASKIAGEYILRALSDMHDIDYVSLRYMNVYGPRQEGGLIMNVLRRLEGGQPPVIEGDGSQSFDFVHVRDVADVNLLAMASDASGETLNVGSGIEASVKEVVGLLIKITGSDLKPVFSPSPGTFVSRRVGSSKKAQQVLGFQAQVPLAEGLQSVVDWSRDEMERQAPRAQRS